MKKNTLLILSSVFLCANTFAQETDSTFLKISGSADVYWKYDFAKQTNIPTYFTEDQNSISLGMLDLALKKSTKKSSFVGEISFGPRGQYRSLVNGDGSPANKDNSFHIQNLYASYSFTDNLSVTAGFMGTFIGYELISPAANFHYSTSYLFSSGPFQNAGIKANYNFSSKINGMIGLFNDWNNYQDFNGVSHIGAQLGITPAPGSSIFVNFLTGSASGGKTNYSSGTLIDLTAFYSISQKISLGINAADYTLKSDGGYIGIAFYPKYTFNTNLMIGARTECFKTKNVDNIRGDIKTSFTLSANLKHGGLTFIPEIRLDNSKLSQFLKEDFITPTRNTFQCSAAIVYAF